MSKKSLLSPLLGKLSPDQFLQRYWQKKPLLVRGAFPSFHDPVTANELAGLACEAEVSSRLVMERGGTKPWQVTLGPHQASRLRKLPPSHWTLLVQGVDRYIPGVAVLLESFRFIPDWRVEDVMISFAPRGGTVGPHVDRYDVFLIQGQGRRRWRIDSRAPTELKSGLDLRILKQFHSEREWVLESGDMLYLPPGLAHFGTALEDCLTYSIGFRAPSATDLLATALDRLSHGNIPPDLYEDPHLRRPQNSAEISQQALGDLRQLLEKSLRRLGASDFDQLIGEFLTESKGAAPIEGLPVRPAELRSRLKKGKAIVRSPASRMAFIRRGARIDLFVDGRPYPLSHGLSFAALLLTREKYLSWTLLSKHFKNDDFMKLLGQLLGAGALQWEK